MEFKQLSEPQKSLPVDTGLLGELKPFRIGHNHPRWNFQSFLVCIFDGHSSIRRPAGKKEPQLLAVQRMEWIVDLDYRRSLRTQGIVSEGALTHMLTVS